MSYRVLDPRQIPFAEGLDPDDPMRDPRSCGPRHPFYGYDYPHHAAAWILVAVPTATLNPDEFVFDRGVWLRSSWSDDSIHRSGISERAVVEGMVASVQQGQSLRPAIVHREAERIHVIDGYHRVAANLTAQVPETLCHLLVEKAR